MIRLIKYLKYGCFALTIIFSINFFQLTMEFLTLGLTSSNPFESIDGEAYTLVFLGFAIMFYVLHIVETMANKVKREIRDIVVAYYMQERIKNRPIEEIEAEIKKIIYDKFAPEKTKWLFKDVITNITDSLEEPFAIYDKSEEIVLPTKPVLDIKKEEAK